MNDANEPKPTRKRAIWIAMLVTLVGLTILPGFTCTAEKGADGSFKGSMQT
jgi:hypothetical protein